MFKHNVEDGELSVFAGTDELLFACSKGHYWIIEATQHSVVAGNRESAGSRDLGDGLLRRFGPDAREAMGM